MNTDRHRILIVDDDAGGRRLTRAALVRGVGSIWAAAYTALVVPRSTAIRAPASRTAEAAGSQLPN